MTGLTVQDGDRFLLVCVDRTGAERLVGLWALAARSPRSIVHLPVRSAPVPDASWGPAWDTLDLLLVHHSLRFPASAWKDLRAGLDTGRPHTAVLPADTLPEWEGGHADRSRYREYRDHLRCAVTARTLVLTGSPTGFAVTGSELRHCLLDTTAGTADPGGAGDLRTGFRLPSRGRGGVETEVDFLYLGAR
ncbi:hypothetical protein [Nocardiopsis sp. CC223A]|uniref:hypothetical protein n=1 Tax=Nocardiopsis sp. CC223A TaxID=3044051 RepID=UPI00278C8C28|nr:hypothetical protein [Nocardiopsis sp. CC223A]